MELPEIFVNFFYYKKSSTLLLVLLRHFPHGYLHFELHSVFSRKLHFFHITIKFYRGKFKPNAKLVAKLVFFRTIVNRQQVIEPMEFCLRNTGTTLTERRNSVPSAALIWRCVSTVPIFCMHRQQCRTLSQA